MHPYGNSFTRIVLGNGLKLSRHHSSESKRNLHHLMESLHITTPTVKQSLPQMHDQQGWEQFLKHTIMDSSVPSVTSPDPSVMLKGTMRSLRKKPSPQPELVNALKSMSLESGLPLIQITNHLFHSSLKQTWPKMPHSNTALPPSNDAIRPRGLARPW